MGGVGGLAMILVGSPGALLVLYWHSPLLLSMATPGQHYFPALLSSPTFQHYSPWPYYSPGPLMILAHECGLQSWRLPSRPYW